MLKQGVSFFIVTLLMLTLVTATQAQGPDDQETGNGQFIRLQTATFDPLVEGEPTAGAQLDSQATGTEGPYYIVQFNGPVEAVWAQQLEQLGAKVLGYIPDNAHIVHIQPEDAEKVKSLPGVRWVGPYRPGYKVAPDLTQTLRAADEEIELYVVAFPGESKTELETFLKSLGAVIDDAAETEIGVSFRIKAPAGALAEIAQNPAINWVEPYLPIEVSNDEARRVMNVESIWQSNGYFGQGQIVAVSDSGLSVDGNLNADFAGRLRRAFAPSEMNLQSGPCSAKTNWTDLNGHGTHVTGSVLGNGQNSGSDPVNHNYVNSFAGNAPEAELVFMAVGLTQGGSLECISTNGSFITKGYEEGARISSNSWGGGANGSYGLLSSIVDNYVWQNKDYLVLFAAGNSGPGASTIGSPGTSKNILSVGASENNRPAAGSGSDDPNTMANFSSRGPTTDGRIKPDIAAPGTNVVSVRGEQSVVTPFPGNSAYASLSGTSMATPLTAGAAAVVREWLAKERNVSNPSAALMKALMIHGAFQLPGATTPNNNSGWGRIDVKNTINAQYTIFDDYVQGLATGQTRSYSVTVVGATQTGTLFAGPDITPGSEAVDTLRLEPAPPRLTDIAAQSEPAGLSLTPLPGFAAVAQNGAPIQSDAGQGKTALSPTIGLTIPITSFENNNPDSVVLAASGDVTTNSFLLNLVGGGDFEDPGWTNIWSNVWLGFGVPVRTNNPFDVISGNYSMWLGGTPIDDSVWYPLSFPDTIASDFPSELRFKVQMDDLDVGFDQFCYAFTDVSGFVIGFDPVCTDDGFGFGPLTILQVTKTLSAADKAELAGQTGYLVFYNLGDGVLPHMSAFIDDIELAIDFADPTLTSAPSSGPPGSVFLLTGSNNTPYGPVDVCLGACPGGFLGVVFANAKGNMAAYLEFPVSATPGPYTIETSDFYARKATTTITLITDNPPTLNVSPTSGQAGTRFNFSGANFLPNDANIAVTVNNIFVGNASSDSSGALAFALNTSSNTAPGIYNVQATDSANRSATVSFEVTEIPGGNPMMSVSPTSGPPGSVFIFNGENFTPNEAVTFSLDGQSLGQLAADGSGRFQVQLTTQNNIAPGLYTLLATQGNKQASAQFQITGGGIPPQTGNGLYVTLIWTDPPAQANAAATLVNDLNLRVEGPGGPYLGNAGNSADTRNNVETIRLETPAPGDYTIIVEATTVNGAFGTQPYALVATTAQNFGSNTASVGLGTNNIYLPIIIK